MMSLPELVLSHGEKNEATDLPFWYIACKGGAAHKGRHVILAGFWFNREDAERHLANKAHRYPTTAFVYCDSGHNSWHVRALYEIARMAKHKGDEWGNLLEEISEWSMETFPNASAHSKAVHLVEEAGEVLDNPGDLLEIADCIFLLAGLCRVQGYTFEQLQDAVRQKLAINRLRDWGDPDANGVVKHVKGDRKCA